jgi:hypothetical protein
MLENSFFQFALELLRALLVDELSGHVRHRLRRWFTGRGAPNYRRVILGIHRSTRNRLLHRMFTEEDDDL